MLSLSVEARHVGGACVVTVYTDSGQVASRSDAAGTTQYTYDARDRLLSVTHADGVWLRYTWDAAGNRTSMSTALQSTTYGYDALNRLVSVGRDGAQTRYTYTAVGSRESATMPNGTRSEYGYDVRNRLRTLVHRAATGAVLLGLSYTVDATGLRTQAVESGSAGTRTTTYQYDALKRLTREQVVDASRGGRTSVWTYDAVGNRLSETRTVGSASTTTQYRYDSNDRLERETTSDGSAIDYRYDANGSLIEQRSAQGSSVYTYDGDRRMVGAITPEAVLSYRYDADGIRQQQTMNGSTTRFVVDPTATYAQVLEERSATDNVLYLLGDDRIARTAAGATDYLHADGLGSTRMLSGATGTDTARWWYEAFGEVEARTGNSDNAFLFAGEQLDPNLGHYYLRARYMDPGNGRFTQMDLWQGNSQDPVSLHKYLYANASPVSFVDPSGYMTLSDVSTAQNLQGGLRQSVPIANRKAIDIASKAKVVDIYRTYLKIKNEEKHCKIAGW